MAVFSLVSVALINVSFLAIATVSIVVALDAILATIALYVILGLVLVVVDRVRYTTKKLQHARPTPLAILPQFCDWFRPLRRQFKPDKLVPNRRV